MNRKINRKTNNKLLPRENPPNPSQSGTLQVKSLILLKLANLWYNNATSKSQKINNNH